GRAGPLGPYSRPAGQAGGGQFLRRTGRSRRNRGAVRGVGHRAPLASAQSPPPATDGRVDGCVRSEQRRRAGAVEASEGTCASAKGGGRGVGEIRAGQAARRKRSTPIVSEWAERTYRAAGADEKCRSI